MKALIGTEKQVKWAESIRKVFVEMMEDLLTTVKSNEIKKVTGRTIRGEVVVAIETEDFQIFSTEENFQESVEIATQIAEFARNYDSAKFFIDNRDNLILAITKEAGLKNKLGKLEKAYRRIKNGDLVY